MMLRAESLAAACVEALFAVDQVPFFQELYKSCAARVHSGMDASTWCSLPTTSKADYRNQLASEMLARGRTQDDPWLVHSRSSGSEGEPAVTVCARVLLTKRWLDTLTIHPAFQFPLTLRGYKTARLAAPRSTEPGRPSATAPMADRILPDRTLLLPASDDALAQPPELLEQAAQELLTYAPDLLYVDPNQLCVLLRHMARRGMSPPPVRAIACTNAMLTAAVRRRITAAFPPGTPVSEVISMSELGWVGMECPRGVLHLNTKSYFLELLLEDGLARGELTVTSLGDQVMPRVRYRTGDSYQLLPAPCSCGSAFPSVRMEGRRAQLVHATATITPRAIDDAVGAPDGLVLYQLEQQAEKRFVLRTIVDESAALASDDGERVLASLTALLGGATVTLERVTYLPSEPSGKLSTVKLHEPRVERA